MMVERQSHGAGGGRREDQEEWKLRAVHLCVNRRPSGKLPGLSVHREKLRGSFSFSGHCTMIFGIIRARNAPFAPYLLLRVPDRPSWTRLPLGPPFRPPFLPASCSAVVLSARIVGRPCAQTRNSNKRKIRAAVRTTR